MRRFDFDPALTHLSYAKLFDYCNKVRCQPLDEDRCQRPYKQMAGSSTSRPSSERGVTG